MEINLEQLKKNFMAIRDIRDKVMNVFNILETHLIKLKKTYGEFVENNRQNLFVFGLDSFQFQSKLIDIEYDDMKRLFLAINNRMYCEYYKLYKIISDYVKENIPVKKTIELIKLTNNFPIYKDLEPFKQYDFDLIQGLHENTILLLYEINDYIINKENELLIHKKKQDIGLNINNFVTTFNYNILMTKEKGMLFISYIEFFHNLHTKYLQRFAMKMNLMYNQVTHDIRFEDGNKPEIKKQDLLNNFESDNIDKSLIKEIRRSFTDSDSNSSENTVKSSDSKHKISLQVKDNNQIKQNIIPNEIIVEHSVPIVEPSVEHSVPIVDVENTRCLTTSIIGIKKDDKIDNHQTLNTNNKKSLFKENVKKMMSGMRLFKKQHNEDSISSVSSESTLNDIKMSDSPIMSSVVSDDDKYSKDDVVIQKSKSAEEIFMEISKQCDELTVSFIYPQQTNDVNLLGMDYLTDANVVENEIGIIPVLENEFDNMSKESKIEDIINLETNLDDNSNDIYVKMADIYDDPDYQNNEKEEKEEEEEKVEEVKPLETTKEEVTAKKKKRNNKNKNRR